ncbi:MAG TPA: ATP-binding protein [Opitutaceae bacterium]|nr:ATP-binding protein [Opitutaceae bacterium]
MDDSPLEIGVLNDVSNGTPPLFHAERSVAECREEVINLARRLGWVRSLSEARELVVSTARKISEADGSAIFVVSPDGIRCVCESARTPHWQDRVFPLQSVVGAMAQHDGFEKVTDLTRDGRSAPEEVLLGVRGLAGISFGAQGQRGLLCLYWERNYAITPEDEETLGSAAELFDAACARLELEQRLAQSRQQVLELKDEFHALTYALSHDLRAPLRHIDGYARVILEDAEGQMSEERIRFANTILRSAHRLGELIEATLGWVRLGQTPLYLTTVDMHFLVRGAWEKVSRDQGRALQLSLAEIPPAQGCLSLLQQLWAELLSNAAKFSSRSQHPRVEVGGQRQGNELVYWVRDNGVGLDVTHCRGIFGLFKRFHGDRDFPGQGVGLALAQRIVRRHRGRIWIESAPGRGTTVFFALRADLNANDL